MTIINRAGVYKKGISFWGIFLLLYFAYKYFPVMPLKIICAVAETNFQHYKASFFSWLIICLFEFILYRKKIDDREAWFYSRICTATILPWFVFVLWYLGPALYGKMPSIPLEILYANIVTILVGFAAAVFEQGLSSINYFRELRAVILALCISSVILYMIFTFVSLPWADVFIEPDWK
jgi:hypothetical protein